MEGGGARFHDVHHMHVPRTVAYTCQQLTQAQVPTCRKRLHTNDTPSGCSTFLGRLPDARLSADGRSCVRHGIAFVAECTKMLHAMLIPLHESSSI